MVNDQFNSDVAAGGIFRREPAGSGSGVRRRTVRGRWRRPVLGPAWPPWAWRP